MLGKPGIKVHIGIYIGLHQNLYSVIFNLRKINKNNNNNNDNNNKYIYKEDNKNLTSKNIMNHQWMTTF